MTVIEEKMETKTARRKRERAEREAQKLATLADRERKLIEERRKKVLADNNTHYCSDWWAEHIQYGRGPYIPNTPCFCDACQGKRDWPSIIVFLRSRISFECYALTDGLNWPRRFNHEKPDKVSVSEAAALGLHVIRRRAGEHRPLERGITAMVSGCEFIKDDGEQCDELRFRGEKYCSKCRLVMLKRMKEEGYFG